ncbi:outer membrane cobalamin receptor protein [Aequorivita sublithincola DSM 14238]|uniref:Outer membrane cobalamin receptor protein n=1 Tax=Aequorivita sublithincola (strain DSM 14238 / LMG 21431 / ACAM 643 / 9-3) TaxID=746697 RepID=I3YXC4_AEQSU|nr:TonB-dependent receptor [Aequorivita sublithincola]AFL81642.1 outer membrane cobalamin receptor protein [Aequorivita sublithincola DSM 14238]
MKISVITFLIALFPSFIFAQTIVSGTVTDNKGMPIPGANVYIEGAYDGASTDDNGKFSFETSETGTQTLTISYVSFEPFKMIDEVSKMKDLKIVLRDDVNSLDTVTISAGSFSAGDNSKISVLKPLDIVTTASALGDFVGALQTLPGTTTVDEDGRLFVRGGDASETQIFIDGIRVFTPYSPTTDNIPTRGRYSPFLFDGITFSTGGYSAEYGQALSSVLLLNTIDEPDQEKTDISIMTVGAGLGHTEKWEKSSLSLNASYINLAPYIAILPDRNDWHKPFETASGEAVFRQRIGDGLLKIYGAFDTSSFSLTQEDINQPEGVRFKLNNQNFYTNASYSEMLNDDWTIFAGGSYTYGNTKVGIDEADINDVENSAHFKVKLKKRFSNRFKLNFGAEQFVTDFNENYSEPNFGAKLGFNNNISVAFTEADIIFSRKLALKLGVRGEYSELFKEFTVSPRASFAFKTGKSSQLSLAYGDFFQQPENEVLKFTNNLEAQHTQHYIMNYQYSANNRIFRAEAYRKQYSNLVTFNETMPDVNSTFANNGDGYAQGLDIFWRDNESIKNVDYWVSYSYLDTQRKYKNFPIEATPNFANTHNISVVGKYWIEDWKSQVGFSYQYGSGRTYTDLNKPGFLQSKTKSYNGVSLNLAYLISQQKILYFSINNAFAFKNVNGYQYANTPDANGNFARRELRPAADQFFFVGFFWTISTDGKDNQLDNL